MKYILGLYLLTDGNKVRRFVVMTVVVVKNKEFLILHWELLRYDSLRSSEFFSQGVFMTTAAAADRAEGRWQRILIENS